PLLGSPAPEAWSNYFFSELAIAEILHELASLIFFLRNRRPGRIGVEAFHLLEFIQGFGSKVLLVNYAVVADHEGPHTCYFVLCGCRDQCKAADHGSFDHKVHFAERRRRALSFKDLEKIPMVRFRAGGIALFDCPGDVFTDGTTPPTIGVLPRQAILFSGSADDPLGILVYVVPRAWLKS